MTKNFNKEKKDAVKSNSNSILIKSVIGIFTSLIQYPKLADLKMFDTIKKDSRFFFIVEVKNLYIENPSAAASIIIEKITDEKIKNLFGILHHMPLEEHTLLLQIQHLQDMNQF